ncbi:MAG: hypothetical protein BYD32DRAFT_364172 [Podila humilis]|nr:MAG: hypothetical protein BYD32DRAFT_364172 [Podila humilis]
MDASNTSPQGFIPFEPPSDLDSESDVDINIDATTNKKRDHPKVPKHYRKSNPTIYDNISVYAPPNSNLIFRCSRKKADWYLARNLARSISPTSIHLTFSPAGQGRAGDSYFLEARENKCVVCGKETAEAGATMLHVVPEQYRKWFPLKLKSHSSHDILVACPECNAQWDREAAAVRKRIVALYKVPLEGVGWVRDHEAGSAKRAAGAVVKKQGAIPLERLKVLEHTVLAWWEQLPTEDRKGLSALKRSNILNDDYRFDHQNDEAGSRKKTKGWRDSLPLEDAPPGWTDVAAFVRTWRQAFLDKIKPRHLSAEWRTENPV